MRKILSTIFTFKHRIIWGRMLLCNTNAHRNNRCNILTCTIFHHPTRVNGNTCPIPVCPQGCVVQMLNDVPQNTVEHTSRYSICVHPLCVLENVGVSECYTGILILSSEFWVKNNTPQIFSFSFSFKMLSTCKL